MTTSPLITIEQAKATLNLSSSDAADDAEVYDVILAASEVIAGECVALVPTQYTEDVRPTQADGYGTLALALANSPILSIVSVTPTEYVGASALNIASVDLSTPGVALLPMSAGYPGGRLRVVYTAGMESIPESVKMACRDLVQWLWTSQRGSSSSSVLGAGDEDGPPVEGEPPRVAMLLRPYLAAPTIA